MSAFDVVVVGGGAAGLTAAREAARRGARTALVSDGPLGGDCTHTGCVPSKALLAAAERGLSFDEAMAAVRGAVERVARTENAPVLQAEGIQVIAGRARLARAGVVEVGDARLRSSRIVLATGAGPVVSPVAGLAEARPLTTESVFGQRERPDRLAVLGGGAVGVELAQAFAMLGVAVTMIEAAGRLLPGEEPEASAALAEALGECGVDVRCRTALEAVDESDGRWCLRLAGGGNVAADRVLVAAGRAPATAGLGLAEVGVVVDEQGYVRTDASLATTVPGIWAVGDVTGRMPFTHAAAHMARIAVRNALSPWARVAKQRFDPTPIPWVTFTHPEVARVGMTEAEAAGHGGRVAYVPLSAVDRAVVTGATRGFVKLIAGPRPGLGNVGGGRLLGATIVAPRAGELIHEVALAMRARLFTGRLAQTTHAYPTWSTAVQQAAAQFFMTYDGRTARRARPGGEPA
ncbi:MAG: FAD-dependent oxidoreductase [Acidimicrobiia bacterium]|nr:FAD-dependent oxidoreductase [Acidimicrobiia bacterium]